MRQHRYEASARYLKDGASGSSADKRIARTVPRHRADCASILLCDASLRSMAARFGPEDSLQTEGLHFFSSGTSGRGGHRRAEVPELLLPLTDGDSRAEQSPPALISIATACSGITGRVAAKNPAKPSAGPRGSTDGRTPSTGVNSLTIAGDRSAVPAPAFRQACRVKQTGAVRRRWQRASPQLGAHRRPRAGTRDLPAFFPPHRQKFAPTRRHPAQGRRTPETQRRTDSAECMQSE